MAEPTDPTATETGPAGNPEGTGEATPTGQSGQSSGQPVSEGAPATSGPESQPEETFFDPKAVPEELKPAYKQMQRAFVKKTENLAKNRQKVEAYDEFMQRPIDSMERVAQQYGYQLVPTGQQPSQSDNGDLSNWQPQSWQDVLTKVKDMVTEGLQKEQQQQLEPLFGELKNLRKSQLEKTLDEEVPEWRQYEEQMSELLQSHPSLVNDPLMLARLAIPEEVQQSKAMQAAMKRLQTKSESGQVSGGSSTSRQPPDKPKGPLSFQQAVDQAKKQIAAGQGIMGGSG